MGQCGCGDFQDDVCFQLRPDVVISVGTYAGCDYCGNGPGFTVHFWDSPSVDYLDGVKRLPMTADEFGGNDGFGHAVVLFEIEDLVKAARELADANDINPESDDSYTDLGDWLQDNGYQLVKDAIYRCYTRMRHEEEERQKKAEVIRKA